MIVADQSEVIDFLAKPTTHGATVARIDTHGSVVFLAGKRVYKLKRAVLFEYMDYSSLERRRAACETEIRVNRRTAPGIYRRAVPVRRGADGRLAIDGEGAVVEWLVEMNRFDERTLFDRMAVAGALESPLIEALADIIVDFHASAERRPDDFGRDEFTRLLDLNVHQLSADAGTVFNPRVIADLDGRTRAALAGDLAVHLDARQAKGFVRRCHGDLHLRNICLMACRPTLFDAIEFSERLVNIDVLYDLAFLLMDLWHRDLKAHATLVLSRYLGRSGGLSGLRLMPSFLSCRAAIRAHVTASAAAEPAATTAASARDEERAYLALAVRFLEPATPRLLALGGLSGTGKTALAMALRPSLGRALGAVVLRSDVIRKRLLGVPDDHRLGPDGYRPDVTARVYRTLHEQAAVILDAGHDVIADAVHASAEERAAIEEVARAWSRLHGPLARGPARGAGRAHRGSTRRCFRRHRGGARPPVRLCPGRHRLAASGRERTARCRDAGGAQGALLAACRT